MGLRFAEVWEFNRNKLLAGTQEQQGMVLNWFDNNLIHGTPFHRVIQGLDRRCNQMGNSYYIISFINDPLRNPWAQAHRTRMWFYGYPLDIMPKDWWDYTVPHELGHVVGWNLLSEVDASETWADDFRIWLLNGQSLSSPVWFRMIDAIKSLGVQDPL